MDSLKGFGLRLKNAIKNSGYSQKELSELLRINQDTITNYVKEKSFPKVDGLFHLCKILNISADWLLYGTENIQIKMEALTVEESKETGYPDQSIEKTDHQKVHQATIVLSNEELDIITKYRQLDSRDQEDICVYINIKCERVIKKGRSSGSMIGGSGEEAAVSDIA